MTDEIPFDDTYSVGEVASALGIPRSTLLYWENQGVVRPGQADENGYRSYAVSDLVRLMNGIALKNAGVPPREMAALLDAHPFSAENMRRYDEALAARERWLAAVREGLARLAKLRERVGVVRDEWVEPYYLCPDGSSGGFHGYPRSRALRALRAALPVSSMGVVFDTDYFDLASRGTWGLTVPVRHAPLVGQLPPGLRQVGGVRCLTAVKRDVGMYDRRTSENTVSGLLRARMEELGLRQAGPAFCPYSLNADDEVLIMMCLPVA